MIDEELVSKMKAHAQVASDRKTHQQAHCTATTKSPCASQWPFYCWGRQEVQTRSIEGELLLHSSFAWTSTESFDLRKTRAAWAAGGGGGGRTTRNGGESDANSQ